MNPKPTLILLLFAVLASACQNEELAAPEPVDAPSHQTGETGSSREAAEQDARIGAEFTLGEGESAWIEEGAFTVTLDAVIEDSRCPQGAECFWEGNAKVQVTIGEEVYILTLGKLLEGDQNSAALGDGMALRVVQITPYPGSAQDGQPYQVTLIVERETSQPYNYPVNV